jgi:hypothetical protein
MVADIQSVAAEVGKLSLGVDEVVERILRPVETEFYLRYGHELGSRLNKHFLWAFEDHGPPPGAARDVPIRFAVSRWV